MRKYYIIYWIIVIASVFIGHECQSQVIYSSWTSAQILHAVETEKPVVKRDTVSEFGLQKLEDSFIYKGFVIYIDGGEQIRLRVMSGNNRIILKPDDEYEVIEKLLTLSK